MLEIKIEKSDKEQKRMAEEQMMDLEKLRTFKGIWRKQPKSWVLENIDEYLSICKKVTKEINDINKELKEAKKKCIDFEAQLEALKNEPFEENPAKKIKFFECLDMMTKEQIQQIIN